MGRRKRNKADRKKRLSYVVVNPKGEPGESMYAMLTELVREHHQDLRDARIALAWATSWKADVDGRLKLGKCKKIGDPDRELMKQDFVIILEQKFWQNPTVTDDQRRALLDHELCHGQLKHDENGEPVEDEKGRKIYRLRRHDVEEFTEIMRRHGCYKRDLEEFAKALYKSKQGRLDFENSSDDSNVEEFRPKRTNGPEEQPSA